MNKTCHIKLFQNTFRSIVPKLSGIHDIAPSHLFVRVKGGGGGGGGGRSGQNPKFETAVNIADVSGNLKHSVGEN